MRTPLVRPTCALAPGNAPEPHRLCPGLCPHGLCPFFALACTPDYSIHSRSAPNNTLPLPKLRPTHQLIFSHVLNHRRASSSHIFPHLASWLAGLLAFLRLYVSAPIYQPSLHPASPDLADPVRDFVASYLIISSSYLTLDLSPIMSSLPFASPGHGWSASPQLLGIFATCPASVIAGEHAWVGFLRRMSSSTSRPLSRTPSPLLAPFLLHVMLSSLLCSCLLLLIS